MFVIIQWQLDALIIRVRDVAVKGFAEDEVLLLLHLVLDSGHDLKHHLTPSLPYLDNPLISRLVDAVLSLNSLNLNWIKEYRYTEAKNECVYGTYKPSPHPSPHTYIYIYHRGADLQSCTAKIKLEGIFRNPKHPVKLLSAI